MSEPSVEVIIPTYKPEPEFAKMLHRLAAQTVRPCKITVINTGEEYWESAGFDRTAFEKGRLENKIPLEVRHIRKDEFDHGGTRALAAEKSSADILLFMTQDAMPADRNMVKNLISVFSAKDMEGREGCVAAAYARQLPAPDCGAIERYTRSFNYGKNSRIKSEKDIPKLGIKTFFCSNVCAAYVRSVYEKEGGFVRHAIFNEDMIFAGHLIWAGYRVAYRAESRVIHSHNYNGRQQFHRNFDLAVSQAEHPEIFQGIPSEKEGIRLVKSTAGYLIKHKKIYLVPQLIWHSGCKYAGYFLGKNYQKLPRKIVLKCSVNSNFWKYKFF